MIKMYLRRNPMVMPMALFAMTLLQPSLAMAEDFFISTQADFDRYRQATFAPGDRILFERRQTFEGMFAPTVVGTSAQPIRISTFGTGTSPRINNNGVIHPHPTRSGATVSAGVFLYNPDYVTVSNLEITNNNGGDQDDESLFGILVLSEDTGRRHQQIIIDDNYVHDVNGDVAGKGRGGIHVIGRSPEGPESSSSSYNDVRIINNVVEDVGGVGIATDQPDVERAQEFTGTGVRPNAITNLYVARNSVKNSGRNSYIIRDSEDPLIEYNLSANSSLYDKGHSFFNFNTIGAVFQYNEAYGNTGPADESDRGGFDADFNAIDTTYQYNYSHSNNYFAGTMKKENKDVTFRYNISVNERFGAYFYGFENNTELTDLKIYNNTHYFDATIDSPVLIVRDRTPHESTFNNNIFYSEDGGTPGADTDDGVNVTFDTNVYFQWTPPSSERNALTENPRFMSPGDEPFDVDMEFGRDALNGYRLADNSPYSNSGVEVSNNGGQDFWGTPLSGNSVGAGQFSGNQDPDDNDNDNGNSVDLNGDFRDGLSGWTIEDGHIDLSGRGHDDDISARLRSSDARLTRTVSVLRNTNYRLRGRIETNGRFGFEMGGNRTSSTAAGSARDFKRRTFEFNTGNNDSIEIFAEYRNETGRFDNITLENLD